MRLPGGCRALELGSGTGLAGIVAAAISTAAGRALDLTLSDRDPGVLGNIRANLSRNAALFASEMVVRTMDCRFRSLCWLRLFSVPDSDDCKITLLPFFVFCLSFYSVCVSSL